MIGGTLKLLMINECDLGSANRGYTCIEMEMDRVNNYDSCVAAPGVWK